MSSVRRRLRFWAAAWLVFQAASLSALVPRECCLAHQHKATPQAANEEMPACHETAQAQPEAQPMAMHHSASHSAEGTECPMHHAAASTNGTQENGPCAMRGMCDGPAATFLALLTNHGLLTDRFDISPDVYRHAPAFLTRENLIVRRLSPDSPPPRA